MRVFLALFLLITVGCGRQVIEAGGSSLPVSSSLNAEHVAIQTDLKMNFVSFLASCEMFPDSKKICEANLKELRSVTYTDEFKKDDGTKDNNTVGRCTVYDNVMRYVQFLKGYAKPGTLTALFLSHHEMAHCLLDQGHAPEKTIHVMAPALLSEDTYKNNYSALIFEVFKIKFSDSKFSLDGSIEYDVHADGTETVRRK